MNKIMAISTVISDAVSQQVIGYKLASIYSDNDTVNTRNILTDNIISTLSKGIATIDNMAYVDGKLVGTQGSLDRLPKFVMATNELVANNNVTIAYKIGDEGYRILDYMGRSRKIATNDLIQLIKSGKIENITNGKIVEKDGFEFVSAISGEYDTVENKAAAKFTKIRAYDINSKVSAKDSTNQQTINMQSGIVKDEISYNDVFNLLNADQRSIIEKYYVWWTTMTFNGLTKSQSERLKAMPKKVRALAKIRGTDLRWEYAGSKRACLYNPSGIDYCELGHRLTIVHLAKGYNKETGECEAEIKFGSTCVSDFFEISKDGLSALTKVTNSMNEEIEYIVKIFQDNIVDNEWKQLSEITSIVDEAIKLSSDKNEAINCLANVLGNFQNSHNKILAEALYYFRIYNVPFPRSLIRLCRKNMEKPFTSERVDRHNKKEIRINYNSVVKNILVSLYPTEKDQIDKIIKTDLSRINDINELYISGKFDGRYAYDPNNDDPDTKKGNTGRDKYTDKAKYHRGELLLEAKSEGLTTFTIQNVHAVYRLLESCMQLYNKMIELTKSKADEYNSYENKYDGIYITNNIVAEARVNYRNSAGSFYNEEPDKTKEQERIDKHLLCKIMDIGENLNYEHYMYGTYNRSSIISINAYRKDTSITINNFYKLAEVYQRYINDLVGYINNYIDSKIDGIKEQIKELEEEKRLKEERKRQLEEERKKLEEENRRKDEIARQNALEEQKHAEEEQEIREESAENLGVDLKDVDTTALYIKAINSIKEEGLDSIIGNESFITVANAITSKSKYQEDKNMTYKQLYVVHNALKLVNAALTNIGMMVNPSDGTIIMKDDKVVEELNDYMFPKKKASENNGTDNADEEENWKKKLADAPEMAEEVQKVIDSYNNGNKRITEKEYNIAVSVQKWKSISAKQYKYIKRAIEVI